ncbi:MAG: 3-methylornithyl-N6-L-lysine dehydrogenase PylD [Proteobacteria bacterium]|nr:3-methylornithyl-N6-L-lysine dehydrogenase PylD [Pseudomonadota bacterium]
MTRLETGDLAGLGQTLDDYDDELRAKTGRTLRQIACRAAGLSEKQILQSIQETRVAVISMSAGQGVLEGFAHAVRDIVSHLGYQAFVPNLFDVGGIAGAMEGGADVVFMADDARFIAANLSTRLVVDNAEATGRGYGAALDELTDGIRGRRVLVIGAGRVGKGAAGIVREMGGEVGVFDSNRFRSEDLAREVEGIAEGDLEKALETYTILVDASPARGIIGAKHIKPSTTMVAPGIPLGLTPEAQSRIGSRLIHDPLQIGVATMMISAVKP